MRIPLPLPFRLKFASALIGLTVLGAAPAQAQGCEVKIGAVGPLSGPVAAWGLALQAGVELQAALANSEGGLRMGSQRCTVRVVAIDARCSSAGGAVASNTLASQDVAALVGPMCVTETMGLRTEARRHGQVAFGMSYMADAIGTEWPLLFHALQDPQVFGPLIIREARSRLRFDSVVVVGPGDTAGADASRRFARMYSDQRLKVTEESYPRGSTDFAPLAERVLGSRSDLVEFSATPPGDAMLIVQALLAAGYKGNFGGLGGIGLEPVLQGAGAQDRIKGYFWMELAPVEDASARKLRVDYERLLKRDAPANPMLYIASNAAEQLLRAISAAGTDRDGEQIAAALRQTAPESRYFGKGGWRGRAQFGINQELAFPVGMGLVVNGRNFGVSRLEIPAEK